MTWYFEAEEKWLTIYDHTGDKVAENVRFSGVWDGAFPKKVHVVMREQMGDGQPSRYNQLLLADAATNNIKEGTPPNYTAESRPADSESDNERSTR